MDPFGSHPTHGFATDESSQSIDLILEILLDLGRDIHRNKRPHHTHVLPETLRPVKV